MEAHGYTPTAESLLAILEKLRAPGGCPWDRAQTRESLSACLAEECAELLDAIDRRDPADICDELGDLFMNLLFQVVVAQENGEFNYTDMAGGAVNKMIRRHAHIFGDETAADPAQVTDLWLRIKEQEKKAAGKPAAASILDGVAPTLCALTRAEKLQKKAAQVGFDWTNPQDILAKIEEELAELKEAMQEQDEAHTDEELGDFLFAVCNLIRFRKRATADQLLRAANRKFESRFRYVEQQLAGAGIALPEAGIDRMEALWQQAKTVESSNNDKNPAR